MGNFIGLSNFKILNTPKRLNNMDFIHFMTLGNSYTYNYEGDNMNLTCHNTDNILDIIVAQTYIIMNQ